MRTFGKEAVSRQLQRDSRNVLYESRKDDVIASMDDFGVIIHPAQGPFDNGEDGPLVSVNNDGSLSEVVAVGKKDPRTVEDDLV